MASHNGGHMCKWKLGYNKGMAMAGVTAAWLVYEFADHDKPLHMWL